MLNRKIVGSYVEFERTREFFEITASILPDFTLCVFISFLTVKLEQWLLVSFPLYLNQSITNLKSLPTKAKLTQ